MIVSRLWRRLLSAEGLGLLLAFLALQALVFGVTSSLRGTQTFSFYWMALLAASSALSLSRRGLSAAAASTLMIVLGLLAAWVLGARLAGPLADLSAALVDVFHQVLPAVRAGQALDTTGLAEPWLAIVQSTAALVRRFDTWLDGLRQDAPVNDPLVRQLLWILILWLVSGWMGWFAGRRRALAALLPPILLLAAVASYSERHIESLWLIVFILLLLMGIWNYREHTAQWERRRVDYSDSIRYDAAQAVILLSLLIGVAAFVSPSISWREIRDILQRGSRNEIAETLGLQPQPASPRSASAPKPVLPRDHLLTGGFAQSERVVMTVRTGELAPRAYPSPDVDAPRHYWRSTTYDMYMGAGWVTGPAAPRRYPPDTPLVPGLLDGYRTLHLDVQMVQPEGKLFWSGILFSADVPLSAYWRSPPASSPFVDPATLLQADLFAARSSAAEYAVDAYVPAVSVEELRAAAADYPESIRARYLQLPTSVPERVRRLAGQLTADEQTAYDQARAIEAYLRTYPYDLDVAGPPADREVADYFLFDLKKGYCDYYATAMVVLARASGLPARFVSGYSPGSYDPERARYIVRELNAHSWAEVYFPGIGWIEFEPTAAQPEIERPLSMDEVGGARPDETASRLLTRFRLQQTIGWVSPAGIVLLGLVLYYAWIERWLYVRMAPAAAVEAIYRRLYRLGRPLAGGRARAETASEFQERLLRSMSRLALHPRLAAHLAAAQHELRLLTDLYQGVLFSERTAERRDVRTVLHAWRRLRLRLLAARLAAFAERVVLRDPIDRRGDRRPLS